MLQRNQSPVLKMIRPGTFSNQALLSKFRKDEKAAQSSSTIPSNLQYNSIHPPAVHLTPQTSQTPTLQIQHEEPRLPKNRPKLTKQVFESSPKQLSHQPYSPDQLLDDPLDQMVQLSAQLVQELELIDAFPGCEPWVLDMKNKISIVQQNVQLLQQQSQSKESTASKEKSLEKEIVINEQQIEDYLDQINQAKESGGSSEIITALQNGILTKLHAELQEEKNQRLKIEQEASALIILQEDEIQRLEAQIRALEQ